MLTAPELKIIIVLFCMKLVEGEPDFNFNEDCQFGCSEALFSTEASTKLSSSLKNKRLQLHKRETEGSGEEDYDQYDYDGEIAVSITEISPFTTHGHRHHHGIEKTVEEISKDKTIESNIISNDQMNEQSNAMKIDEDIGKSVSKLESDITKTIENTKNLKDHLVQLNNGNNKSTNSNFNTGESIIIQHEAYDKRRMQDVFKNDSKIEDQKSSEKHSPSFNKNIITPFVEDDITNERYQNTLTTPSLNTATKEEYESNTTAAISISLLFTTEQQESTEETQHAEFESSTIIPTTIELYLTSEDPKTVYTMNKKRNDSANIESTTVSSNTFSNVEYKEYKFNNTPPVIKTRLRKYTCVSGKLFRYTVPLETFYDNEDGYKMKLELLGENEERLKETSWIQFNAETKEIYGLPMEDNVSKWRFKLKATDSGNESTVELVEMFVYQHKGLRSVNHEFILQVELLGDNMKTIDWQLMLIQGIANILDNKNTSNVVVREIVQNQQNPHIYNFTYFNESLPTGNCQDKELNNTLKHIEMEKNSNIFLSKLRIKTVSSKLIGSCQKQQIITFAKNYPPVPRNQVDRVNAIVGHLLIYKVPEDTFYDPNDNTNLKLVLLTVERKQISQRHWLKFDSKNKEFYGIPKSADVGSEEFLLVAEDSDGLSATDALIVVVNHPPKRDYSVYFKAYLAIRHEQFNTMLQRKFVERLSQLFGDDRTDFIQIRSITTHHDSDGTIVNFYNTTLYKTQNLCREDKIESVKKVYFVQKVLLRDKVKKIMGMELNLTSVQVISLGQCQSISDVIHRDTTPIKNEHPESISIFTDDYIFSFVIPAIIMLAVILLAAIVAYFIHRRRISGKMELGDEEERKSFRPKGIPVIFQDELDEKPEIGNKSPIILKDEKPPLLPPSYNQSNFDGENDVDEYVPPPAVIVGSREIRGKSPATPSYRKPPPYVSP